MAIIQKTTSVWKAFRAGQELENAAAWKNTANAVAAITTFLGALLAVASAWGYQIDISQANLETLAGGVIALISIYHSIVHLVTSAKVGFGGGAIHESPVPVQSVSETAASALPPSGATAVGRPAANIIGINVMAADKRDDSANKLPGKINPDDVM